MKPQQAMQLGKHIAALVANDQAIEAYSLLAPVLAQRTPFALLGRIGEPIGAGPLPPVNAFLQHVAAQRTEGGWVVIGSALGQQLDRDLCGTLARCREFVIGADVWYGTDILGERIPGPALLQAFAPTLAVIAPWREDGNRWVRRTVGVAIHFWAKRARGAPTSTPQAQALLGFLEPLFSERDMDAVKGVGWALKTLGRYYPDVAAEWLAEQVVQRRRLHRALMLRKALTYLNPVQRLRATGGSG